jgi:hypothetical protein
MTFTSRRHQGYQDQRHQEGMLRHEAQNIPEAEYDEQPFYYGDDGDIGWDGYDDGVINNHDSYRGR